jgi:hypothetical protein
MNLLVISSTSWGKVALSSTTYQGDKHVMQFSLLMFHLRIRWQVAVNVVDLFFEAFVQHFVSLIQNE